MGGFTLDDILAARKQRDSWWTVFFVDPLACRLALLAANHTSVTPNGLTRLSILVGFGSAWAFAQDQLVAGAALFYLSFMIDCMDGKVARLKGNGTPFGLWLDYVGDRIRVLGCAFGIAYGCWRLDVLLAAVGVVVLDMFRYINVSQLNRVRAASRGMVTTRMGAECLFVEDVLAADPGANPDLLVSRDERPLVDLQRDFRARFPWYDRLRRFLVRHRVRTHMVSGIEFHAAVFVWAPLIGVDAFIPAAAGAGALLLAFEAALIYRTWLAARAIARVVPQRESLLV
ncbi:CDP-alcohol phosphatidyltransferase family protein [Streptosporangiaceae bacterium NEAU-GS5]|nr:CDP-alcohol phosphatidyltransferase family protein [Streptosporangiaceae bacterium NEAU-GS5]